MTEPMFMDLTLPSGLHCRVWVHPDWLVLEANGRVSHCQRKAINDNGPDAQDDLRGYAAALLEASC